MGLAGFGTLQIGLEAHIHGALPDHPRCPDRQGPGSAVSGEILTSDQERFLNIAIICKFR